MKREKKNKKEEYPILLLSDASYFPSSQCKWATMKKREEKNGKEEYLIFLLSDASYFPQAKVNGTL